MATHRLTRNYGPVSSGDGIASVGSLLWYTSYQDSALITISLESGVEARRYRLNGRPTGMLGWPYVLVQRLYE